MKYMVYICVSLLHIYKFTSSLSTMHFSRSLFKSSIHKSDFKIINPMRMRMLTNSIQDIEVKFNNSVALSYLKPKVVFVLGGPGAGKGTQCELLSNEFSMVHLSAGELLRMERLSGTANGKLIDSFLKEGKIVPVQITLDLLKAAMQNSKCNRFLVDGFPRNWDNIQGWELSMTNECDIDTVLFIDCPENVLQDRILNRGLTSGRTDDNLETARKRFVTFQESTLPILQHYEKVNKLIKVRGDRDKNEVFSDLKRVVSPFISDDLFKLQYYLLHLTSTKNWMEYSNYCIPSIITSVVDQKVI